ncbi:MAG: asparagine synthase-related protein [Proteobacteria bacterium]|nr:asparagine synthase-related protein [Pseudomonadota bacterium]
MCGIAGVVRFDRPARASATELRQMQRRLAHRGPDGRGEVFVGHAALAHTRLAMIAAGPAGAQPMVSTDGRYHLVYNGELANDEELRAAIGARAWTSRSDAETVLAAWARWGEACVERLDGMFAFAVYDATADTLALVRDRLGVKPLAFTRLPDGLAFASEAQALAPMFDRMRPRVDAIVEYLVAPAFTTRSPFAGVEYLAPGTRLHVARGRVDERRYWRWGPSDDPTVGPGDLRAAFEAAVRGALHADAPLGIFLSGGLDSTAIAAVAPRALPAFTLVFDHQARWAHEQRSRLVVSDDTPFARLAAAERAHHEVRWEPTSLDGELAAIARVDDALPAWEQELSQRALARAASTHVKGVLVGDAADELHHGYHFLLDPEAVADPMVIVRRLGSVPIRPELPVDLRLEAGTRQLIVERWLPRLLHNGDIHTMAFGLEARVPFAANALVELAARIGPARGVDKQVLRDALRGLVPEPIRTRVKSALPKDQGALATYRAACRRVIDEPHPVVAAVVDLPMVRRLVDDPRTLDEAERAQLFRVICLQHWAIAHEVTA